MDNDFFLLSPLWPPFEIRAFCRCALGASGRGCMRRPRLRRAGCRRHRGCRRASGTRSGDDSATGGDGEGADPPPPPSRDGRGGAP
jgi:hypothetical protein